MPNLAQALDFKQKPLLISAQPPNKEARVSLNLSAFLTAKKHYLLMTGSEKNDVLCEAQKQINDTLPISHLLANSTIELYYSS